MKTTLRLITLALTLATALPSGFAADVFPTNDLPPPTGVYVWNGTGQSDTYGGVTITYSGTGSVSGDFRMELPSNSMTPPAPGETQVQDTGFTVRMRISTDGGTTFQHISAPGQMTMRITGIAVDPTLPNLRKFETEVLSLNISAAAMPVDIMLRESPTKASTGKTSIQNIGDGACRIDSFFDVFTEISINGGQTWVAADKAMHLACKAASDENTFASDNLSPEAPLIADRTMDFGNGISIRNAVLRTIVLNGGSVEGGYTITVTRNPVFTGSYDGRTATGGPYQPIVISGQLTIKETSRLNSGNTRFFDTEMLSLDLAGDPMSGNVMLRESPTKQSLGCTSIRTTPDGMSHIACFFDVFTELSIDGGQTWLPCLNGPCTFALPMTKPASEIVLAKGGKVPGAGVANSGVPADAIITSIGTPSLNANGSSACFMKWSSKTGGVGSGILKNVPVSILDPATDNGIIAVKVGGIVGIGTQSPTIQSFAGNVLLDNDNNLVFGGTLTGEGITAKVNDTAIMVLRSNGGAGGGGGGTYLDVLIRRGIAMPEVPGGILQSVTSFVAPGGGCVVINGLLQQGVGGITLRNDACLWFCDAMGVGHLVAQENTTVIDGSTVKSFSILKPPAKIMGQTLNHNSRELLWNATLTNGRTVLIHTDLP